MELRLPKRLSQVQLKRYFLRVTGHSLLNLRRDPRHPGHWMAEHAGTQGSARGVPGTLRGSSLMRLAMSNQSVNHAIAEESSARQQSRYRHEEHVAVQKAQAAKRNATPYTGIDMGVGES